MKELFNENGWLITQEDSSPTPEGKIVTTVRANTSDSASIIAFTKDGKILLLREYRPFWGCYVWMLPSGKVDKESDNVLAAQRELQEETGFRANRINKYFSADYAERIKFQTHIYIASDLEEDPLPKDEDELIEVHEVQFQDAIDKVLGSPRVHMASAYALMRYAREHT